MEDFLKFLLIAGVIIIGIVKEAKKNKAKKDKNKRPAPTITPMFETAPEAVPMPIHKSERKQENRSPFGTLGTLGNRMDLEGQRSTQIPASHMPSEEPSAPESEFTIHSTEEARRAIIWGEILQRKY